MNRLLWNACRLALVALPVMGWMVIGPAITQGQDPAYPTADAVELKVEREVLDAPLDLPVGSDALSLSLEEAASIALQRNLALVLERYGYEQQELSVFGNMSIYDLNIQATAAWSDSESATASTLVASAFESRSLTTNLSQLVPTGGTASMSWRNSRSESDLQFNTLNPSYDSTLNLSFDQPLLRNLGRSITERGLRIARLDKRISRWDFESQVILTLQDVERAYWGLIEAREQLQVAEEALSLAEELHERNKIEVDVGTRAPLELVQSEATIATRQEGIIDAQQILGDAEDRLRRLLNLPVDLWTVPIEPTTEAVAGPVDIDLQQAVRTAWARRPEMRAQELAVERAAVDVDFFHNQKKPRLDLNVTYTLDGTAGFQSQEQSDGSTVVVLDSDLFDAMDQVFARDFEGWSADLTFAFPLQNRQARANARSADLTLEDQELRVEDLKRAILTEVRAAVREVRSARQQISSAEVSRRLQERNLEAEQKRYENGMSTSFQVTEIQEDLTQARSREVSAMTTYRIALAEYYRSVGRLLEQFDVEIIDPDGQVGGGYFIDEDAWLGEGVEASVE